MIFVTVGTLHLPFDRLMVALEDLPTDDLVVQYGASIAPPGVRSAVDYAPFDEIVGYLEAADTVITHAGCGTVLRATRAGHTPIVVPRRKRFGEHVDDHQVELTSHLAEEGRVIPVWDVADLRAALASAPPRRDPSAESPGPLHAAVRAALLGEFDPAQVASAPVAAPATETAAPANGAAAHAEPVNTTANGKSGNGEIRVARSRAFLRVTRRASRR